MTVVTPSSLGFVEGFLDFVDSAKKFIGRFSALWFLWFLWFFSSLLAKTLKFGFCIPHDHFACAAVKENRNASNIMVYFCSEKPSTFSHFSCILTIFSTQFYFN